MTRPPYECNEVRNNSQPVGLQVSLVCVTMKRHKGVPWSLRRHTTWSKSTSPLARQIQSEKKDTSQPHVAPEV